MWDGDVGDGEGGCDFVDLGFVEIVGDQVEQDVYGEVDDCCGDCQCYGVVDCVYDFGENRMIGCD